VVDYKLANIVVLFLLVVYFTEERDKIPNNTQRLLVHGGFKLLQYTAAAAAAAAATLQLATPFLTLESETSNSCLPHALISFQCHFTSDLFHTQTRPPSLPHTTHSVTFLGFVLDFAFCVSCCLVVVINLFSFYYSYSDTLIIVASHAFVSFFLSYNSWNATRNPQMENLILCLY